ncbi:MAG: AI-2E family transporter [Chthoniobacterales bacterium]
MKFPTPFQKRICWSALTLLAFVFIVFVIVGTIFLSTRIVGFLQPVLLPVAVSAILAYLLDPVVKWICSRGASRMVATILVFCAFLLGVIGIGLWIGPPVYRQGVELVHKFPETSRKAQNVFINTREYLLKWSGSEHSSEGELMEERDEISKYVADSMRVSMAWLQEKLPNIAFGVGNFLTRSLGGFLGIFGVVLSMVLVPIFLFYFLKDGPSIAENWSNYIPLKSSPLKTEIVSLLNEINDYLIAFFRGQMLVSLIDGALIAILLIVFGIDYAVLIGLMVGILGIIPYAGTLICWIPAVIVAAAQFGNWQMPLLVTVIFIAVNQLDGLFIAPRIVGGSVGLHALTVIISVIGWSVVLGGLLGALLAVPLTATFKVLLRRYFWDRPLEKASEAAEPKIPERG